LIENSRSEERPNSELRQNWVWYSRRGTTDRGVFSVLGAVEVIFAIGAYWGVAIWAHTQAHLLVGVLVAPLLLLRSKQSIELGVSWFKRIDLQIGYKNKDSWTVDLIDDLTILGYKLPLLNRFLSVIVAIVGLVPASFIPLILAVLIRIIATLRYLGPGIRSLSANWWRTLFATDMLTIPEVMPGYSNIQSYYDFDEVIEEYRGLAVKASEVASWYLRIATVGLSLGTSLLAYLLLFGPSYLYRLSIKSTAWVHWPLAYISRPLRYADDPEEVRMRLWSDPREWLRRLAMIVTFSGVLIASIPVFENVRSVFPAGALSIVEYAVLIDVRSLFSHPWRAVALISAAITLALTWYGFELSILVKRSTAKPDRLARANNWAALLEYTMRVRDVCGWIFWALVFVHATLWLVPSTEWLKGYPQTVLQFIYGDYLPPALA
jgi:hypothetical protein